jgi:hypothetical protein
VWRSVLVAILTVLGRVAIDAGTRADNKRENWSIEDVLSPIDTGKREKLRRLGLVSTCPVSVVRL